MLLTDTHVYFFGKGDPFSNWTPSPMRVPLSPGTMPVDFLGGEQLFMAWKAMHFADYETLCLILKATDPSRQKALGKRVTPFDEGEWKRVSPRYMFKVAIAKYGQNPGLLDSLLEANGRTFVEASPFDRTWGVGLGQDDVRIRDEAEWRGGNWLGLVHDMAYGFYAERRRRMEAGDATPVMPADHFMAEAFPHAGASVDAGEVPAGRTTRR